VKCSDKSKREALLIQCEKRYEELEKDSKRSKMLYDKDLVTQWESINRLNDMVEEERRNMDNELSQKRRDNELLQ
jgi:hypothetical protein